MSNTDFDPNFVPDPANFFAAAQRSAVGQVATSVDDNPDEAARAIELAKPLGLPSTVVHSDLDHYEGQLKTNVSSALVANNPFLRDYINSHPLAAKVSNDDYGQLDKVSQVLKGLAPGQGYQGSILQAAVKGFKDNYDYENTNAEFGRYKDWLATHPLYRAFMDPLGTGGAAVQTANQLASGVVGGLAAGTGKLYQTLGGNEAMAARLTRDLIVAAQVGMAEPMATPEGLLHPKVRQAIDEAHQFAQATAPYLHAGKVPPVGVHPLIDEVHIEQAKMDADALSDALKEAAKSSTRERSPEMFASYIRGITDGEIGIAPDAVRALYGDKVPAPDDGILGFVPDIADKLATAEATGADVKVPLADYLARVEPEVAKELQDHIRARPEGLTVEEGKNLPGIEAYHGSPYEFEAFDSGKIGSGEGAQSYGYGHYVAENPEVAKSYSYDLNQLAQRIKNPDLVPQGEDEPIRSNLYRVRVLRHPDEFLDYDAPPTQYPDALKQLLEEHGLDYTGTTNAGDAYHALALKLDPKNHTRGGQTASKLLEERGFAGIKYLDQGSRATGEGSRNYVVFNDKDLEVTHRNGEARVIRQAAGLQGVRPEQVTLRRTSSVADEKKGQYSFDLVNDKGEPAGGIVLVEEDGGKTLYVDDITSAGGPRSMGPSAMRDLLRQIKEQFPNAERLEGLRVSGAREKAEQVTGKDKAAKELKAGIDLTKVRQPKQLELPQEGTTRIEDRDAFAKASAIGMTVDQYKRYQRLIEKRAEEDRAAAESRAMEYQRKTQTAEWKANRAELRPQVKTDIEARPDVELDEMLRGGKVKLAREGLTDAQISALPREFVSADGIHPDDLAGLFGGDSSSLVDRVVALAQAREASGMKPDAFLRRMVDAETDRQMEVRYGNLDKNILEEAKDQVLSETQEQLLHEETLARAAEAGLEYSIGKEELKAAIKGFFDRQRVRDVSSDAALADAGRAGRATEMALLKGDYAEAFRQKQRQYNAVVMANLARKFEKEQARFEKLADRFSQRVVKNFPPEFTNATHDILMKVGMPVKRSIEDLQRETQGLGYTDLQDFVTKRNNQGLVDGTVLPVPEYLFNKDFRGDINEFSVDDFREVKQALDALAKQGRDEHKIDVAGEKQDLREWVKAGREQLEKKFPPQKYQATPSRRNKVATKSRQYIAAITNLETLFARFDGRDPRGMFTKAIIYPAAESANHYASLTREFARTFSDMSNLKDAERVVRDVPFVDPADGRAWDRFTRKNLEAVVANIGNEGNWKALYEGFKVDPKVLWNWIEQNTTPEDIQRAQDRGKAFAEAKRLHDIVERNVNGVASKDIDIRPFTMHGRQYEGWYHPIIDDPIRSAKEYMISNAEDQPHSFWPTTATGFTKERTGAKHVLDLNIDMVPIKLNQMLHAVAFKDFVHNTNKIFRDKEFRASVRNNYGVEYLDEMDTWLRDVAGNASYDSRLTGELSRISNYFRQNVITNYIAFNPYTVQKHGLSAAVMSAKELGALKFAHITAEVGADFFYHAVKDLFTKDPYLGNTLWKFIKDNSEEIQRRGRNWQETTMGQHDITFGKSTWRNTISEWGSSPVALSDMISAAPLWLGKYREAFNELGDHGQAVAEANRAVRRAHGSTAITNQPRFVRRAGPLGSWMTSLYGYFGTVMQRRIELFHDINDTFKLGMEGEIKAAAKNVPGIATSLFAYYIWPAVVEEMVTSEFTDDRRGLGTKILTGALGGIASTFLYLRELTYGLIHGREPGAGLAQGPLEDLSKLMKDIEKKPLSRQRAGRFIQDGVTVFGDFTGRAPKAAGSVGRFVHDFATGQQKPKTFADWYRGISRGDIKQRIER